MCVCVYLRVCVSTCVYLCVCMCMCMCMCACMCVFVCGCVLVCVCAHACVHVHVCVCVSTRVNGDYQYHLLCAQNRRQSSTFRRSASTVDGHLATVRLQGHMSLVKAYQSNQTLQSPTVEIGNCSHRISHRRLEGSCRSSHNNV